MMKTWKKNCIKDDNLQYMLLLKNSRTYFLLGVIRKFQSFGLLPILVEFWDFVWDLAWSR